VNWIDLVIIALAVSSAVNGYFRGGARQLLSYAGFWIGLLLGAAIAPSIAKQVTGAFPQVLVTIFVVFGAASLLSSFGTVIGTRIWGQLRRLRLGAADSLFGSGISLVAALLGIWMLGHMFARVPIDPISSAVNQSRIMKALNGALPPAPAVFSEIRQLFASAGFPDVFAELEPEPAPDAPLPADPKVQAAVNAARASTVKIVGEGCGGIQTGSGFVAGEGLVVTNAHVVSGIDRPFVEDRNGRHRSTPVFFDPDFDLALLRTSGLSGDPLPIRGSDVGRGHEGAALGFPGGGSFRASAGVILDSFQAVGRDIYGRRLTERPVYQIRSEIHPGNSGGPFVDVDGQVTGVMFSASATRSDVAYGLQSPEVGQRVRQNAGNPQTDTGPCAR
jgi:S1-C subfamily serine protease